MKKRPKVFKYHSIKGNIFLEESVGFLRYIRFYYNHHHKYPFEIQGKPSPFKNTLGKIPAIFNSREHHSLLKLIRSNDYDNFILAQGLITSRKDEK